MVGVGADEQREVSLGGPVDDRHVAGPLDRPVLSVRRVRSVPTGYVELNPAALGACPAAASGLREPGDERRPVKCEPVAGDQRWRETFPSEIVWVSPDLADVRLAEGFNLLGNDLLEGEDVPRPLCDKFSPSLACGGAASHPVRVPGDEADLCHAHPSLSRTDGSAPYG